MTYQKQAQAEPLPGYRLIEPLGRGGFGEVWKCEVPGGLSKAIKFVYGNLNGLNASANAQLELRAFELIKTIRHPFLLSLERVEILNGELIFISELAEMSLADRLKQCRENHQFGIPREELLGYLMDAAEALDYLSFEHNLQHLDIKPANLFLVGNHVKLGDFGLVQSLEELAATQGSQLNCGITPLYSAPEILVGKGSHQCDQYSLAIAYQKLLTGKLPINGKNVRQVMVKHLSAKPDLSPLEEEDRPIVARALSKNPEDRFASCHQFVEALLYRELPEQEQGKSSLRKSSRFLPVIRDTEEQEDPMEKTKPIHKTPTRQQLPETYVPNSRKQPQAQSGKTTCSINNSLNKTRDLATEAPQVPETAVSFSLPGYQVLRCLNHGALGELWHVRSEDGKNWLARLLHNQGENGNVVEQYRYQIQQLNHSTIPDFEIVAGEDRLVLLLPYDRPLLIDRFQEYARTGKPGIPREEVFEILENVALALDELADRNQQLHKGLCPTSIMLDGSEVSFTDYALMDYYWLALGGSSADWNSRYSAPELLENEQSETCDQYSLALIFAEMISGIHPRPKRSPGRQRNPSKVDLTFLSTRDQKAIKKALNPNPKKRFASCQDFLEALGHRFSRNPKKKDIYWPTVVFLAQLQGESLPEDVRLPQRKNFLQNYLFQSTKMRSIHATQSCQFLQFDNDELHTHVPVVIPHESLHERLQAFMMHWKAKGEQISGSQYRFEVMQRRKLWKWLAGGSPELEVLLDLQTSKHADSLFMGASITVRPRNQGVSAQTEMLHRTGGELLESLCTFLQVQHEKRKHIRLPFNQRVYLVPLLPGDELGRPISATGKDISFGGICVKTMDSVPTNYGYLIFDRPPKPDSVGLLVQFLRKELTDDGYEVCAQFLDKPTSLAGQSRENNTAVTAAEPNSAFELKL